MLDKPEVTYVAISSVFPQVSNFPSLIWRSFPGILHFNEISEVSMWSSLRHSKKRVYWKTRITCSFYWSHVTEHHCNCCNCPFLKIRLNYKTRTLSRLFSQPRYKTHLLALLCHFTDQNDKIPYLSYTYTPYYPSYTWSLEMVKSVIGITPLGLGITKARRKVNFKLVYKI